MMALLALMLATAPTGCATKCIGDGCWYWPRFPWRAHEVPCHLLAPEQWCAWPVEERVAEYPVYRRHIPDPVATYVRQFQSQEGE